MNELIKKACVYFHQGWTDIVMCLGLINYYSKIYDEIYVLIRSDAKIFVDHYTINLSNVKIVYIDTDNGRFYGNINTESNNDTIEYSNGVVNIPSYFDIMFHGEHDRYRKDKYKLYWYQPDIYKKVTKHFSEMFYVFYDIDYANRIENFIVDRDINLENETYEKFIEMHGIDYVIYHDDQTNHLNGVHHVSTSISFDNKLDNHSYVNLNKQSTIFFDYIKILQNAKEIHLIDSIWACLIYQLDAKYHIFENNKIKLYCKRGHDNLFTHPVLLSNWEFIK